MITWALNTWGRVVDWIKTGTWCEHDRWGPWHLVDLGREKVRYCDRCGWMETTNHPWRGTFRRDPAMIKYLRRALVKRQLRRARRWVRETPGVTSGWKAWKLDDRSDAIRHAVAQINQRLAADIAESAREARPHTTTEGEGS